MSAGTHNKWGTGPCGAKLNIATLVTVASEIGFRFSLSRLPGARTVYAFNYPHRVSSHALVY